MVSASPPNPTGTAAAPPPARAGGIGKDTPGRHPSGDDRFRMLDASMKRFRYQPDALIEVLHTAQELFGYLKEDLLYYIAQGLKLPPSRVYGVATFYHFFTFSPRGTHTCVVCTGTACHVKGGDALVVAVQQATGATPGRTSADGRVTLLTARCLGACGLAPVVVLDGEVRGKQTPALVRERVEGWVDHGPE